MDYQLQFVPYRRPFAVPLKTARGAWFEREGILLRLERADGKVGFGEVTPLEGFGTESVVQACDFLERLGDQISDSHVGSIPEHLPSTAFGLSSARWMLEEPQIEYAFVNCALLPGGGLAMEAIGPLLEEGFRSFKLKLGVETLNNELALVNGLLGLLPGDARLRLDANCHMSETELESWQAFLSGNAMIDFLEQPFSVGRERAMFESGEDADLNIALDESVAAIESFEKITSIGNWSGQLVVKSSIMGSVEEQRRVVPAFADRVVVSSSFETGIGAHCVLRLAAALGVGQAVGFGTLAFFADRLKGFELSPVLRSRDIDLNGLESIWEAVRREFVLS